MNRQRMRRSALIVGSPFPESSGSYLPGVYKDIDMYQRFLRSSTGGGWDASEIQVLVQPPFRLLHYHLSRCAGADAVYLIFSGHGFSYYGSQCLQINEYEHFPLVDFCTRTKVQIRFIDACRNESVWRNATGDLSGVGVDFKHTNKDLARSMFEYAVNNAPQGIATLNSTRWNTSAEDTPDGGAFSVSLMNSILNWQQSFKASLGLSLLGAFAQAREELLEWGKQQQPVMSSFSPSLAGFNFAYDADLLKLQIEIQQQLLLQQQFYYRQNQWWQ